MKPLPPVFRINVTNYCIMNQPSKTDNRTWINVVYNGRCFSKGSFCFYYNVNEIDSAWNKCLEMPFALRNLLYSMQVTTKIHSIVSSSGNYKIVFYCDSRFAESVVMQISEYLDYRSEDGFCQFTVSQAQIKGSDKIIMIPIKKIEVIIEDCFDSDSEEDIENNN